MFDNQRVIELENAQMIFMEHFLTIKEANFYLKELTEKLAWQQGEIMMFGKKVLEPRLTAWYGDAGKSYTYSGKKQEPMPWYESLLNLKNRIEATPSVFARFNSVLCNYYRNGTDSMGYHADDEKELGIDPVIASVNLGETRRFLFRQKHDKSHKFELLLTHGSLLIMQGAMQHHWQHAIPKEPKKTNSRLNLTFRWIH